MALITDRARRSPGEFEGALRYGLRESLIPVVRGSAAGVGWQACVVLFPFLAQRAIDQGLVPRDWWQLAFWLALLVANGLATAVFSLLRHRYATQAGQFTTLGLRRRLVRHLIGLDAGFHDRADRGDVLTRVSTDAQAVGTLINFISTWVAHAVSIVLVVLFMLWMDLELALIGAAFIPVVLALMASVMPAYEAQTKALQEATAKLTGTLHENIAGVRVIKGFGMEMRQRSRHHAASGAILVRGMALARQSTAYTVLFASLPAAAMVAVLWWGGLRAISGELTVGVLLAFSVWMVQLTYRTEGQVERFLAFLQARTSARRIDALLTLEPAVTGPPCPVALPRGGGTLRFANVGVTLGERCILDDVSLEVAAGEMVVLVGASGSGKSTLLNLPPRLYDPREGAVTLDGVDVRDLRLNDLRAAVNLAAGEAVLFRESIAANIALGKPEATRSEIEDSARVAQAHDFINEMPEGYESVVGERGLTLSGGQRQRVALARAFLVDSRVLLLDDASSSLDPATDAAVWSGLRGDGLGRTLLVATQRRPIAALADRVVLLDAGRIVADGVDADLWQTTPLYRHVLGGGVPT